MVERQIMSNERELSFMEAYWDSLCLLREENEAHRNLSGVESEGLFGTEKEEWEY